MHKKTKINKMFGFEPGKKWDEHLYSVKLLNTQSTNLNKNHA